MKVISFIMSKTKFNLWRWLAFTDEYGNNCFQTYSQKEIIGEVIRSSVASRNVRYAEIFQEKTWD